MESTPTPRIYSKHAANPAVALLIGLLAMALGACFGPSIPTQLSCEQSGICPTGQICDPITQLCSVERGSIDAAPADSSVADAMLIDGAPPGAFCDSSELVICMEFDDNLDDGAASGAEIEVLGAPLFVAGHRGSALRGSDQALIEIRDVFASAPTAFTYEFWLRLDGIGGTFIMEESRFRVGVLAQELAFVSLLDGSFLRYSPFPVEEFFHVAFRVNGPDATLFLNGAAVETTIIDLATPADIDLGLVRRENPATVLDGAIDELRIWSIALTDAQVAAAAAGESL